MYEIIHDDCINAMQSMESNSIETIITDPPYEIDMVAEGWDRTGIAYNVDVWQQALRVAKPGATMLVFGHSRTIHRVMCAIEDAGWKIRTQLYWVYSEGMPHGCDISKAIDKHYGAERVVIGESPYNARRPSEGTSGNDTYAQGGYKAYMTKPATPEAALWEGWNTGIKTAVEPIMVAMKPIDGTFANNALVHGVAGFNIGECMIHIDGDHPRWPATLIHDGSPAVTQHFPHSHSGAHRIAHQPKSQGAGTYGKFQQANVSAYPKSSGCADRFFYCARSRSCRDYGLAPGIKNPHKTVKSLVLCRYLARLTNTPTKGTVLDMFGGSGSISIGAIFEERNTIAIEQDAAMIPVIQSRLAQAQSDYECGRVPEELRQIPKPIPVAHPDQLALFPMEIRNV